MPTFHHSVGEAVEWSLHNNVFPWIWCSTSFFPNKPVRPFVWHTASLNPRLTRNWERGLLLPSPFRFSAISTENTTNCRQIFSNLWTISLIQPDQRKVASSRRSLVKDVTATSCFPGLRRTKGPVGNNATQTFLKIHLTGFHQKMDNECILMPSRIFETSKVLKVGQIISKVFLFLKMQYIVKELCLV